MSKHFLEVKDTYWSNLNVRNGDVEEFIGLRVPDNSDIGNDGGSKIALKKQKHKHSNLWDEIHQG